MNFAFRLRQALLIARMEIGRAFFSRRAFWVYGLALFPMIPFLGHGLNVSWQRKNWAGSAITRELMDTVSEGQSLEEVRKRLGPSQRERRWNRRREGREHHFLTYFDGGNRRLNLEFVNGLLTGIRRGSLVDFQEDRAIFATVFQYFYLRLAIFFGCLGIFMNLFRGEMLDKTLHYWMLAPTRRETLLAGKYMAGLVASSVIFATGTAICFYGILWYQNPAEVATYWSELGASHLFWYLTAAVLACVGYGSVFLAAGLLVRNPIIPAAVILVWESINGFLPATLQKLSVLYYVQSLCPVPALATDNSETPTLVKLLLSPAEPASAATAVLGLLAVTALVLVAAARAIRRTQVNYGTE